MIPAQNNKSSLLLSLNFICKCDRTASPQIEKLHSTLSFRFFDWLTIHRHLFAAYKASLGFIWA